METADNNTDPSQTQLISGAHFSEDALMRFSLWRIWDDHRPLVLFIGLNPSTADATRDDPTMRRVQGFARALGFGGFYMANVFPHISTNPKGIDATLGLKENDVRLKELAVLCQQAVFCWGRNKLVRESGRDAALAHAFPNAMALGINKDGSPKHPLYIKAGTGLQPYSISR